MAYVLQHKTFLGAGAILFNNFWVYLKENKKRPARRADNLTAICEPIV
jgi:hypothetical protein